MIIDVANNAERALRMVREAKFLSYDTETTGLDWRVNVPIGYVVGAPRTAPQPSRTWYTSPCATEGVGTSWVDGP